MKLAGQKNDGAWFRLNKTLKTIRASENPDEIYDLSARLQTSAFLEGAYTAITSLAAEAGITMPDSPSTANAWITRLVEIGIPRQVWYGKLSYTTYAFAEGVEHPGFRANYQSEMHYFAKDLRKMCLQWLKTRRAVKDLLDIGLAGEGNPGGQPDATKDN